MFFRAYLISLLIAQSLYATPKSEHGRLPNNWYVLPEEQSLLQMQDKSHDLPGVEKTLGKVVQGTQKTLSKVEKNKSSWTLAIFGVALGVTTYGMVGMSILEGTAAVKVFFINTAMADVTKPPKSEAEAGPKEIEFTSEMSERDLKRVIEPAFQIGIHSGKVKNQKLYREQLEQVAADFHSKAKMLDDSDGGNLWQVQALVLDLAVDAGGMVYPAIYVFGRLGFRFIWKRVPVKSTPNDKKAQPGNPLNNFAKNLAFDLDAASSALLSTFKFKASAFRFGVGLSAKGEYHLVKVGSSAFLQIIFGVNSFVLPVDNEPKQDNIDEEPYVLLLGDGNEKEKSYAKAHNIPFFQQKDGLRRESDKKSKERTLFQVSRAKFRQGLTTSFYMANFFAKHLDKGFGAWSLFLIDTGFTISVSGFLGMATVTGTVSANIQFLNQIPNQAGIKSEMLL